MNWKLAKRILKFLWALIGPPIAFIVFVTCMFCSPSWWYDGTGWSWPWWTMVLGVFGNIVLGFVGLIFAVGVFVIIPVEAYNGLKETWKDTEDKDEYL